MDLGVFNVGMRIFVSSTCYDLVLLRAQLRDFIFSMGYEPIMSDYEDILYDPRAHTHSSCVSEVSNCDMVVLIVGSRFGGKSNIEALKTIDFKKIQSEEKGIDAIINEGVYSVTQLEVLKAIENNVPVYSFIDKRVWHDHELYEKNKHNEAVITAISFPSIEKQELATYIFEFINFVRNRTRGNNIFTFEKTSDIEVILKKQWANYFQKLMHEQRYKILDSKNMDTLTEKFEDLKTAILTSINDNEQREIARGVVKYRRLFEIIFPLALGDINYLKTTTDNWMDFLKHCEISDIIPSSVLQNEVRFNRTFYFVKIDRTFFRARNYYTDAPQEWNTFITISSNSRGIILEALSGMQRGFGFAYCTHSFDVELEKYAPREENS